MEMAKQENRVLVVKDGEVLDVTEFARSHPGTTFQIYRPRRFRAAANIQG